MIFKPIGKPCQLQNGTITAYYNSPTDYYSIHPYCSDCGLFGPDIFRAPATALETPAGALPALCTCTNMSADDDFCPDCVRMRDEQSKAPSKNSLLDVVTEVEDAAALVGAFHDEAT